MRRDLKNYLILISISGLVVALFSNCAPFKTPELSALSSASHDTTSTSLSGSTTTTAISNTTSTTNSPGTGSCTNDPESFVPSWAKNFVPQKNYYVSPNGSDTNDGSDSNHALKTTAAAFAKLAPGVKLNFLTGTYSCPGYASLPSIRGGPSNPAMIISSDGPRLAKFDCVGNSELYFGGVQGLIVEGIEVFNTTAYGIQIDSAMSLPIPADLVTGDMVFHKIYIHNTAFGAIKAGQAKNITVVGSEFAQIYGAGRQVLQFVAVDNPVLVGNYAHDSDGAFDEVKGGAHGGTIYHNLISNVKGGIMVGGDQTGYQFLMDTSVTFEANQLMVYNNVILNDSSTAFRVVGCQNCVVANNTFATTNTGAVLRILPDSFAKPDGTQIPVHTKNLTVINNIFYSSGSLGDVICGGASSETEGLVMNHNLWFWGTTGGAPYSDFPFTGEPTSLYSSDPLFLTFPTDLHLKPQSPAKGKGINSNLSTSNFDGTCWNGSTNIGAF